MLLATRAVACRLGELRAGIKDRVLVSSSGHPLIHSRMQAIFNEKFADSHEQRVYELILTHALAAEQLGPGGFDRCIGSLLEKIDMLRDGDNTVLERRVSSDIVGPGGRRPTQADVDWVINTHGTLLTSLTRGMVSQALQLAGFAGRVFVERARKQPSVELVRGYSFSLTPSWPLIARLDTPRVVCIDGYIQEVSEIHHLLQAASDDKEPVLLFIRGLSNEVLHTLRVNYDRGSLKVVPMIVCFDLEGINTLNDVSIVSGADLVSSNKGDLISAIKLHESPKVDNAVIGRDRIIIVNRSSHRAVSSHVAHLREKRTTVIDDVAKLLDARIRSLSPNQVIIRIPDDSDFVISSQAIDYVLRAVRSLTDYGTVMNGVNQQLAATVIAAEIHSHRCLVTLLGLGASVQPAFPCRVAQTDSGT